MAYTINRIIPDAGIDDVDARARKALADNGFGILTEIDVKATMKKKLDVEMPARLVIPKATKAAFCVRFSAKKAVSVGLAPGYPPST
mgnify:CR=1 FL=1